jgi:isopentenyl phosphate kinase
VLAGDVDGVFEGDPRLNPAARAIPRITPENWEQVRGVLGGSLATDVTGGMLGKVEAMVELVRGVPGLKVRLFSGERAGALEAALLETQGDSGGTVIE